MERLKAEVEPLLTEVTVEPFNGPVTATEGKDTAPTRTLGVIYCEGPRHIRVRLRIRIYCPYAVAVRFVTFPVHREREFSLNL